MKRAAFLTTAAVIAAFGPAVPAAVTQSGLVEFEALLVKGSAVIPTVTSTVGGLAILVEFVPGEASDGIAPSTDQIVVVLEPALQLPAIEPRIGIALPGGCLVPDPRGGWTFGGSAKTCGVQFYHLMPDGTRVDLTSLVTGLDARVTPVVATKGWLMKLAVDFAGLDPAGIVGPTMVSAAVGNDFGTTHVTPGRESFGTGSPGAFSGIEPSVGLEFERVDMAYRPLGDDGELGHDVKFRYEPGESSDGMNPEQENLTLLIEPHGSSSGEPSLVTWLPAGCLVPGRKGGWTLGDGSVLTCGFRLFQLFPEKTVDVTALVDDLEVRLAQSLTDKSWSLRVELDLSGQQSVGIVSPSMIGARIGNDGGIITVASVIDFFGSTGPK